MTTRRFSSRYALVAGLGLCVAATATQAESLIDLIYPDRTDGIAKRTEAGIVADKEGTEVFSDYVSTTLDGKDRSETQVVLITNQPGITPPAQRIDLLETTLFAVANAKVRSGPSTDYPAVTRMTPGQSARVTGKVRSLNWYQVALTNGARGYIHGDLLAKRPPAGTGQRLVKVAPLPPTGQGTAEQERQRAEIIRQVRAANSQFDVERQVLAAMQQRLKRTQGQIRSESLAESRIVEPQSAEASNQESAARDAEQRFQILAYFEENGATVRDQLSDYNKRFRLSVPHDSHDVAVKRINTFNVEDVEGQRARVRMSFDVSGGSGGAQETETATYSFTMKWTGDSLDLLSHSTN